MVWIYIYVLEMSGVQDGQDKDKFCWYKARCRLPGGMLFLR